MYAPRGDPGTYGGPPPPPGGFSGSWGGPAGYPGAPPPPPPRPGGPPPPPTNRAVLQYHATAQPARGGSAPSPPRLGAAGAACVQWAPALNGCGAGSEEDRALAAELAKEGIVMNVEDGPPEGAEGRRLRRRRWHGRRRRLRILRGWPGLVVGVPSPAAGRGQGAGGPWRRRRGVRAVPCGADGALGQGGLLRTQQHEWGRRGA